MEQLRSVSRETVLSIGFVVAAVALAFFSVAAATSFVCATILVVLYPRIETVIEFSFGPLKARLERNLSASEVLLDQLRELSVIQARLGMSTAARSGRFHDPDDWIFQRMKELDAHLGKMGVVPEVRKEIRGDSITSILYDFRNTILGGNFWQFTELGLEAQKEWRELRSSPIIDVAAIERWLVRWEIMTEDRRVRLEDMKWIIEHHDIRDRDQFLRSQHDVDEE